MPKRRRKMEKTLKDFENEREEDEIEWLFGEDEDEYEGKYSICGYDLWEARHGIE